MPGFYAVLSHMQRTGWSWESSSTLRCTTLSWLVVLYIIKLATYWGASCRGRTLLSWSGRKLTVPKPHWWVKTAFTTHRLVCFGLKIVHQPKQSLVLVIVECAERLRVRTISSTVCSYKLGGFVTPNLFSVSELVIQALNIFLIVLVSSLLCTKFHWQQNVHSKLYTHSNRSYT